MDVLLFQDQDEIRARVAFSIESQFKARVHEAKTLPQALQIIREQKQLDLLIYDFLPGTPELILPLVEANPKLPWLLCNNPSLNAQTIPEKIRLAGTVDRTDMINEILKSIRDLIAKGSSIPGASGPTSSGPSDPSKTSDRDFCRIQTKLLLSVSPLKADIYIKLSETHYVKLFREGDVFDRSDLQKYTEVKGVEYLYLKQEETSEFVDKYQAELELMLNSNAASIKNLINTSIELHETAQSLIQAMGFTPKVQELAKTQVKITVQAIRKSRTLAELWKQLQKSRGKYIHTHSTMCAYVSCSVASKLEWASDSTYQKLSLASFLHDITLSNNDLAKLRNLQELEEAESKFTRQECQDFKNHPIHASEMVAQMSQVPPDVNLIIAQHHEWPDGSGFPRKLNHTHIHPLSCVFIVAHDIVDQMIEGKTSPEVYSAQNQSRYSGSQFKKILKALESK